MKIANRSIPDHQKRNKVIRKTENTRKEQNTLENVINKTARKLVPTSASTAALDTEEVSQRPIMSTKDEKPISAERILRVTDDGESPTNHPTVKKLPQNNETNMVTARKLRELQKKKDEGAAEAAKAAEGAQGGNSTTAEMTDAAIDMKMSTQEDSIFYLR
jgi:hypothetical protein